MKSQIKNILFDLGGVLLDIDYLKTVKAFKNLGLRNPEQAFTKEIQADLFQEFERGRIRETEFLETLNSHMPGASKEEIISAWNALLGDFPVKRYEFLKSLANSYKLGVLSNTNIIHERAFMGIIDRSVGWDNFKSLFQGLGYSHNLGERKPNTEVFHVCLSMMRFKPEETLFIDDTPEHVEGAKKAGMHSIHLQTGNIKKLLEEKLGT